MSPLSETDSYPNSDRGLMPSARQNTDRAILRHLTQAPLTPVPASRYDRQHVLDRNFPD